MRKLDRYLLRELTVPFLIGTAAVVLMFQANMLIAQLKTVQVQSIPFSAILQIVFYATPKFLNMTLPVGMALASSMAVSRLVRESELTAVRAAGTSILRVMVPIALFGVLVSGASWYLAEKVAPAAEQLADKRMAESAILGGSPQFRSNVIVYLNEWTACIGTVSGGPERSFSLTDVLLVSRDAKGATRLIAAKTGSYKEGIWRLDDVYVRVLSGNDLISAKPSGPMVINNRIAMENFFIQPSSPEMPTPQLQKMIQAAKASGQDTTMAEVELHSRFSIPAACAILALVGPVFAVWLARRGAFVGVFLSTLLCFLWYNIYVITTQILAKDGYLSPAVAAWAPNVLFFIAGVIALRRLE
jgi:lipopolysaccharide export system permease protein